MEHRIGFIGLGNIGKPMAVNLLRAGYSVTVHDLRREVLDGLEKLGAKTADSAHEVGAASDIIEIAVVDDAQLQAVMMGRDDDSGVLARAAPGAVVVIHSTVSPDTCREVAALADRVAVRVIDAPVSGAEAGAIAGTLTLLVGGDADDISACRGVCDVIGERVFHLGGIGTGQVAKICNNLMFTVNLRAALEALRLAAAAGIDEKLMREITAGSTANSWSLEHIDAMREMMTNRRQSRDSIAIGNKDLSLAAGLGQSLDVDTPIAAFVSQLES